MNIALPDPFAEEVQHVLRMVFEAGRAKGREEAGREQQCLDKPPRATPEKAPGKTGASKAPDP